MMKKEPPPRVDADFQQALCLRRRRQRVPRPPKMERDHGSDGNQPNYRGDPMGIEFASENDFRHLTFKPMTVKPIKMTRPIKCKLGAAGWPPMILGNQGNRAASAGDIMIPVTI